RGRLLAEAPTGRNQPRVYRLIAPRWGSGGRGPWVPRALPWAIIARPVGATLRGTVSSVSCVDTNAHQGSGAGLVGALAVWTVSRTNGQALFTQVLLGGSAGFFRNGTGFSSSFLMDCR